MILRIFAVIGIISIFKAGAAYLPITSDYQKERLEVGDEE